MRNKSAFWLRKRPGGKVTRPADAAISKFESSCDPPSMRVRVGVCASASHPCNHSAMRRLASRVIAVHRSSNRM